MHYYVINHLIVLFHVLSLVLFFWKFQLLFLTLQVTFEKLSSVVCNQLSSVAACVDSGAKLLELHSDVCRTATCHGHIAAVFCATKFQKAVSNLLKPSDQWSIVEALNENHVDKSDQLNAEVAAYALAFLPYFILISVDDGGFVGFSLPAHISSNRLDLPYHFLPSVSVCL